MSTNQSQNLQLNLIHEDLQFTDNFTYSCTSLEEDIEQDQPIYDDELIESEVESTNSEMLYRMVKNKKKNLFTKLAKNSFPVPTKSRCYSEKNTNKTLSTTEATSTTSIVLSIHTSPKNMDLEFSTQENRSNELRKMFAMTNSSMTSFGNIMDDDEGLMDTQLTYNKEGAKINGFQTTKSITKRNSYDNAQMSPKTAAKSLQNLSNNGTMIKSQGFGNMINEKKLYEFPSSTYDRMLVAPKAENIKKTLSENGSPVSSSSTCMMSGEELEVKTSTKLNQKLQGRKGGVILFSIATFQQEMRNKWNKKIACEFTENIQKFQDWYEIHECDFKTSQADSIAAVILLLVGTKFGVGKKDFQDAQKPLNKSMFSRVEKIKKAACYKGLKHAFHELD